MSKASPSGQPIRVRHFSFDDSLFNGHGRVTKGVPGRLLWRMLRAWDGEGRVDRSYREFRLALAMKLPECKESLEPRLHLLARRPAGNDRRTQDRPPPVDETPTKRQHTASLCMMTKAPVVGERSHRSGQVFCLARNHPDRVTQETGASHPGSFQGTCAARPACCRLDAPD